MVWSNPLSTPEFFPRDGDDNALMENLEQNKKIKNVWSSRLSTTDILFPAW